jgi:transcriptional regulator with XRE-family HTH domain
MDVVRFGRVVRALRLRRSWTQQQLGERCAMSRSKVSRIETGRLTGIPVEDLERVLHVVDARLELDVRWRGAALDRLLDEDHAALVDASVRWLAGERWETNVEASFSIYGERGSIDIFARHPDGTLLVVEVKASIGDVNQTLIGIDRKTRLAPVVARDRGWPTGPIGTILVVGDTSTSRARIHRHEAAFRASLPAGTAACRQWARDPGRQPIGGIAFVRPPDSRRVNTQRVPSRAKQTRPMDPRSKLCG